MPASRILAAICATPLVAVVGVAAEPMTPAKTPRKLGDALDSRW